MTKYENIPEEIASLPQWVCSRADSKVPMQALINKAASSSNPETWTHLNTALLAVAEGLYDYCGFVFADNGIVGIDIDAGLDDDGFMSPIAADIIGACKSYTERSKSGRGFHILVKGDIPFKGKNNRSGVEIYKQSRYFIMTGDTVLYSQIEENQDALDMIVAKYFPETVKDGNSNKRCDRIYSPEWETPKNGRLKLRPVYPRIPDGCRNICLTSVAGVLHNIGYSRKQIWDELNYANITACEPCLPDRELVQIVNSVTRYKR